MPKNKSHKGTLKRVRITKTGKVKHKHAFSGHFKGRKSATRLRRLRQNKCLASSEAKRFEKLLFRRLRGRTQPRSSLKVSPSPEQRRAKREAKWAAEDAAAAAAKS